MVSTRPALTVTKASTGKTDTTDTGRLKYGVRYFFPTRRKHGVFLMKKLSCSQDSPRQWRPSDPENRHIYSVTTNDNVWRRKGEKHAILDIHHQRQQEGSSRGKHESQDTGRERFFPSGNSLRSLRKITRKEEIRSTNAGTSPSLTITSEKQAPCTARTSKACSFVIKKRRKNESRKQRRQI